MSGLPRPDLPPGALRELNDALHHLHHRAGWPSLRTLAQAAGCSHTTVSTVFSTPKLPTWGTLELLVEAMRGNAEEFHQLWLAASRPADDADDPAHASIAGRRDELTAVRRHLDTGTGLLLVTGEAGIGKTHLVSAAATRSAATVVVGRCLPLSSQVPLLPIADLVRSLYDIDEGTRLNRAIDQFPRNVRDALGVLLPELSENPHLGGAWGSPQLFLALGSVLGALASTHRLGLLLDDLHWADATTLDLVEHLVSTHTDTPIVATYRLHDPDVSAHNAAWRLRVMRAASTTSVTLGPLDRGETREQLTMLAGASPTPVRLEWIFARSKGQPLFTEQLTHSEGDDELPDLLAGLLDDRLGVLEGDVWVVARTLGLADRSLPVETLQDASGLGTDQTTAALRELQGRHLLGASRSEPALRHPLVAEAIRRRLVPGEGPRGHALLAQALAATANASPAEVARHWQRAGDQAQELLWQTRAAEAASERYALDELFVAQSRVLELWPPGVATLAEVELPLFEQYAVALDLASALGRTEEAQRWAREAMALDLADEQRAEIVRMAGEVQFRSGDPLEGLELINQAVGLHETLPPSESFVDALEWRAGHLIELGRWDAARRDADRGLTVAGEIGSLGRQRQLAALVAYIAGLFGRFDDARRGFAMARSVPVAAGENVNGEVRLAVREVGTLLREHAPAEEVVQTAATPLAKAARSGFDSDVACVLTLQVCEALLREGDVRGAGELVDTLAEGEVTFALAPRHLAKALVDLRRGHLEQSLAVHAAVDQVRVPAATEDEWAIHHAEIELWTGHPQRAAERLGRALRHMLDGDAWRAASTIAASYARAHADAAGFTGATASERRSVADQLRLEVERAEKSPLSSSAVGASVRADAATWRCELIRLTQRADAESWSAAAGEWDQLDRVHDAAYCRWRAAQAALRQGQGTLAVRLLRRAARDAREHVPLRDAIARTARVTSAP